MRGSTFGGQVTGAARSYANATCTSGPNPIHDFGAFFEQAMWELLHNADCSIAGACTGSTVMRNDIFIGSGNTATRRFVLRAIAYALTVLPKNLTYNQLGAWMWVWWVNNIDVATANRARSVMLHHGMGF